MAERPFEPVPNTPLVDDPTGDAIWKRWLQGLQRFLSSAVRGPGSSTDNAVARWNGTTGTFLNNSGVIIDDSNNVSGIVNLTTTGNTILGDASADTLTINAGTWTLGNNVTATRTAGTLAAGEVDLIKFVATYTADAGGTTVARPWQFQAYTQGANNFLRTNALTQLIEHAGTGTIGAARSINNIVRISSSGNIDLVRGVESILNITGSGDVITADMYLAQVPDISGAGTVATMNGFRSLNLGNASITDAVGFKALDMSGSATMVGFQSELSAGTGKKNINVTGTADNSLAGPLYLAKDGKTAQTATAQYAGSGAPNNANGNDGDFYFRSDGGVLTTIYHKRAGAWVGVV
jgi:hypothetical protein